MTLPLPILPPRAARRARLTVGLLLLLATWLTGAPAGAQTGTAYPNKPIRFVVGFAPGSSIDAVARIVADHLRVKTGQPVVVVNRPGANGMLAATEVAKSAPDGYTVLISNSSTITLNPLIFRKMPYDVDRELAPVALVVSVPFILTVNPDKDPAVLTLADLMARARAQPGKLSFGSAGLGNLTQLSFLLLNQRAGVDMVHVPYKGSAPAQLAVLGKEVDAAFDNPSAMPQIRSGRLRALAVSSAERWPDLPDVPAIAEAGYPGYDISFWVGALVAAGTPQPVIDTLFEAIRSAADEADTRRQLEAQGRMQMLSPPRFAQRIRSETAQYGDIVRRANIQMD